MIQPSTKTSTKTSGIVQSVVALLSGATSSSTSGVTRRASGLRIDVDIQLAIFVRHLDHVIDCVNAIGLRGTPAAVATLRAVRADAAAVRDRAYEPGAFGPGDGQALVDRVVAASEALQIAATGIVSCCRATDATKFPPATDVGPTHFLLTTEASKIAARLADAVSKAWHSGCTVFGDLYAANQELVAFPRKVTEVYLNYTLDGAVDKVAAQRDVLAAMIDINNPPTSPASWADVNVTAKPPGGTWLPAATLHDDIAQARGIFPSAQADAAAKDLLHRVQALTLTVTGLLSVQQIDLALPEIVTLGGLKDRLASDRANIVAALDQVHAGFGSGGETYLGGARALAAALTDPQFATDFDDAIDNITNVQIAKQVALAGAIAIAAGLTAGVGAALASETVAAFALDATVAGTEITWASVGGFAANVLTYTYVDRLGHELVFGPESIADQSFLDALFWNAITMGALHAVGEGVGAAFGDVRAASFARRALKWTATFATDQISLIAIGRIQQAVEHSGAAALPDDTKTLLVQVAFAALTDLGVRISGSVAERLGAAAAAKVNAAHLAAAQASADALAGQIESARADPATADHAALAAQISDHYRLLTDLVASLADDDPDKAQIHEALQAELVRTELLLAAVGFESSVHGPDAPSEVGPVGPGVVAATDEAVKVAGQVAAEQGAPTNVLPASPAAEDGYENATPNGASTTFVPVDSASVPMVAPAALEQVPLEYELLGRNADGSERNLGDIDPVAAAGLANLKALAPTDVQVRALSAAADDVLAFLRLLSLGEFAQSTTGGTDKIVPGSRNNLRAFAKSAAAREFASVYGPRLAVVIKQAVGGKTVYNFDAEIAMRGAAQHLDTFLDADARAAEATAMEKWTLAQWRELAGTAPKAYAKKPVKVSDLGVDRASPEWKALAAQLRKREPTVTDRRIDIQQVMQRAKRGDYTVLTLADRLTMLDNFRAVCFAELGESTGPANATIGIVGEWLVAPNEKRVVWKDRKIVKASVPGSSVPDIMEAAGGTLYYNDAKWMWLEGRTPSEIAAAARKHMTDISGVYDAAGNLIETGDVVNAPVGTVFGVWYLFEPNAGQRQAIIGALQTPGSKVGRVRFGAEPWQPLTPRTN